MGQDTRCCFLEKYLYTAGQLLASEAGFSQILGRISGLEGAVKHKYPYWQIVVFIYVFIYICISHVYFRLCLLLQVCITLSNTFNYL